MIETDTIAVADDQLTVCVKEVGRYAGGSRYKLDARMKSLTTAMLEVAGALVKPVYTYAAHTVEFMHPQKGFRLKTESYIEMPAEDHGYKCQNCEMQNCQYRKVPYRRQ